MIKINRIGLIDVDGHHFPNLALMRISAWHKSIGDDVEWWSKDSYYNIIYMSKIFSNTYSPDIPTPTNCDQVIKGGTGYSICLDDQNQERFNTDLHQNLNPEIERMFPDYSIYPEFDFAVSMTSRGCPRGCSFCHVAAKEGRCSVKVADVSDFWNGQKEIRILDPNITACRDKRDLMKQYIDTGAILDFTQGLDIRLINEDDMSDINKMRLRYLHFAWDNPTDDLKDRFKYFSDHYRRSCGNVVVYVLVNFNSTMEQNLYRIYTLRDLGYSPYVMIYNKPNAPLDIKRLQRWCNNRFIFKSCRDFNDYKPGRIDDKKIHKWF